MFLEHLLKRQIFESRLHTRQDLWSFARSTSSMAYSKIFKCGVALNFIKNVPAAR
jgi:hypothetical protein